MPTITDNNTDTAFTLTMSMMVDADVGTLTKIMHLQDQTTTTEQLVKLGVPSMLAKSWQDEASPKKQEVTVTTKTKTTPDSNTNEEKTMTINVTINGLVVEINPHTQGDHKLVGKTVEASRLSKKALLEALGKAMEAKGKKELEVPQQTGSLNWSPEEMSVFQFWKDVKWNTTLNQNQRQWAASRAKYVEMQQIGDGVWAVRWQRTFYNQNRGHKTDGTVTLRYILQQWVKAARSAGFKAEMKPTWARFDMNVNN